MSIQRTYCALLAGLVLAALASSVGASETTTWEMNSYSDFIRGRFDGVSLTRDGGLSLAPKVETVFTSDQPVIWSVAQGPDGALYVATGHRGRLYRVGRDGKAALLWTADQPEVFAIAVDQGGALYAGTSPDGKVYRIEGGKAAEYFNPHAKYIWSLAVGPDRALYVGTGDQGKIFRVESPGKGELYYDTGQSHVTGLAVDAQGRLLAGSEPNGLLYRISAKDRAFVLYDASLPEIRAIVPMPDGTIYAAALGGSVARRAQGAAQAAQAMGGSTPATSVTTSITVEAQETNPGADFKPPADSAKPLQAAAASPQVTSALAPAVEMTGVEKSAVYRINPDNTVETLWSSKEENVYDLLALGKQILFATDANGRIYDLSPDRRLTLLTQTNDAEATRLLPSDHSILAATANMGRIYRLGEGPGPSGSYEAPPHDAGAVSRWGSVSWRAEAPVGSSIALRTRSGNSAKPDRTWSEWSQPLTNPSGSRINSPNARFIQWKVEMAGANAATPLLDSVTLSYLPQNSPPVVKSINVITQAVSTAGAKAASASSGAAYSVTVTDSADGASSASGGTPTQTLSRAASQQIMVTWQAEDPDGDRLIYDVYFRADGESQWLPIKRDTHENAVTLDGDVFADGKYFFRVVASDRESNAPPAARVAELVSAPVMIDNTPPTVTVAVARRSGATAHIEFEAADPASALRRCEYSLDAGEWTPVQAADGVIDSPREKFTLDLNSLAPGEHLLVIRAVDSANNTGLAKVILK